MMRACIGWLCCVGLASAGDVVPGVLSKHYTACELAELFRTGIAEPIPCGTYVGKVLWVDDALLPKLRGKMQNVIWKGKRFEGDGTFVNRFPGFEALPSSGRFESAWTDGNPAYILDYPANYPLFGKNRDEMRRIAPGVYLGRVWKTDEPTHVASWFILTAK